jgi:predicted PurR-regulated permease PerM
MRTTQSLAWRLSLQAWIGLLTLGLSLWLVVTQVGLLVEMSLIIFGALLVSVAIRPLVDVLARRHIPRWLTVIGIYAVLAGALALLAGSLIPVINNEVSLLQTDGPNLFREALNQVKATPVGHFLPSSDTLAQNLSQHLDSLLRTLVGTVARVGEVVVDLLVVLVLGFFFSVDAGIGERLLSDWVSQRYRSRVRVIITDLRYRLTRWLWAQAAIALYLALVFSIGLTVLGVPFGLTIGLVGGVLELIPYVGGITAWLLAVLSALTVDPWLVLWLTLFYVVVVEVEAHVVSPAFYGRVVHLHPSAVLVALLVGAKVKGVLGVLFAVPVTVVLMALLQELRGVWTAPGAEPLTPTGSEES